MADNDKSLSAIFYYYIFLYYNKFCNEAKFNEFRK